MIPLAPDSTLQPAAVAGSGLLRDQLYRYAEELQTLMQSHGELEQRFRTLSELHRSTIEGHSSVEGFIQLSQDIYLLTDCAGMITQCNPAAAAIASVPQLPGSYIGDLIVPAHLAALKHAMDALIRGHADATAGIELHFKSPAKAAALRITAATLLPARHNGVLQGIHWMIRDLTPQREAEFETQITSLVLDNAAEGVVIADVASNILAVNPAFTRITGYAADEVIGRTPAFLQADIAEGPFYADLWQALPVKGQWRGQISNRKKNGERFSAWQTLTSARDSEGKVLSYICVLSDLSRLFDAENRLLKLAHYDPLTELPNRQILQDRLQQLIAMAKRRRESFSLFYIGLDGFSRVNEAYGFAAGDVALKDVAHRFLTVVRGADTVTRVHSDEFIILMPGLSNANEIGVVAAKLICALSLPALSIDGHDLNVGASLGCATYPAHGTDAATLLRHAQQAMRRAKQSGGNKHYLHETTAESHHQGTS